VRPGHETSSHYFSCSSGTSIDSTKSVPGHVTPNMCFCILRDLRVTLCIPVHSGHKTSTHYFSCSGRPSAALIKSAPGHVTPNFCPGWPDHLMGVDKFDLNWRYIHGLTKTFQGCALRTDTPTPAVVHDLVEHDQPND
jgi:hypothetical protein